MVGKTIVHYRALEEIGESGMRVVYKARDTRLDRFAAIKVLLPEKAAGRECKTRFVQEAKAASALNQLNAVVICAGAQGDGPAREASSRLAASTITWEELP